ncbi:MAG: DNA polymerase/3'-5' exonuclease PolX [Gemmatimonadota bacterium]|jgi:DNA polymerase (family 10)
MSLANADIAALLDELADLLEIKGSNPFRIRAYRNAVRTVESLTRPVARMVEEGEDLQALPGIGKDMASHLTTIVETGRFPQLEEVAEEVPRSLAVLVKLDGVGPKKAAKLFAELGVETVDQLEEAVRSGEVEKLAGFGKKSAGKILTSIETLRSLGGRFQLSEVEALIAPLVAWVEEGEGVERLEVAGSFRRRKETVGDVDLLVQVAPGADGAAIVERFAAFAGAARVEAAGGTKGSLVLRSGLQVDLRVIPPESWGAALHYFTGSKEHNVRVRQLAQRRGLRVNEWGVFVEPSGERVGGASEADVFASLDLDFIPPELRENRGEIEAAAEHRIPRLLELGDLRGDLQMHSTWSDGKESVEAMALACRELGYEYLAITDHSPALAMVQGLTPERAREQWREIEEVRRRVDGIELFRSCEVDILRDGTLDMPDEILEELDLVVVSVHSHMDMGEAEMTERVLRALRHPRVDILAHPTGRILNRRRPFALDVEAVLQAAGEMDVAVELNADPNRLDLNDVHVCRARELGVPVAVSTDAHSTRGLRVMRFGVAQARRGWLGPEHVLNCMSLDDFRSWLKRGRT